MQLWPYFKTTVLNTGFPAFHIFCPETLNFLYTLKKACLDQRTFWIGGNGKINCNLLVRVFKLLSLNYKSIYGEIKKKKKACDKNQHEDLSS